MTALPSLEPHPGTPVTLAASDTCPALDGAAPGPVVVLLPGIGGDVSNVREVHDVLGELTPRAVLTFRWAAYEETATLLSRFSIGLNRLAACSEPGVPVLVLAHSAGGVLASLAANRITADARVVVVTVASPLGGVDRASPRADRLSYRPFALELGTKLLRYPAPAKGVQFVHVRTHPEGDEVMTPAPSGHRPDDPRAVVPGALEHALPEHVSHEASLLLAAQTLVRSPERFGLESRARGVD